MADEKKQPIYPVSTAPAPCCKTCTLMTGSEQGLASLMSEDGYAHHSRADLEASAAAGCPCCRLFLERMLRSNHSYVPYEKWHPRIYYDCGRFAKLSFRQDFLRPGLHRWAQLRYSWSLRDYFYFLVSVVEGMLAS